MPEIRVSDPCPTPLTIRGGSYNLHPLETISRSTAAARTTRHLDSLIARARSGDGKAAAAPQASARYLGLGLGGIVNVIDPDCIVNGGEITTPWDQKEPI